MKRKILLIHNGYPLGEEVGDKVRVLNMAQSLQKIGLKVFFLAFYKRGFSALRKERANAPMDVKCFFIYTSSQSTKYIMHDIAPQYQLTPNDQARYI